MAIETQSRSALKKLIGLLQEIDERWCSEEWNLFSPEDIVGSHRALMHILEASLAGYFEQDARKPNFRRIVTTSRKLTGDNSDAIYFDSVVSPDYVYEIKGEIHGAVYFSMTIENDADSDAITTTGGVINDKDIDIDEEGKFVVTLGGPKQKRNWLPLRAAASRVTTRHYFEQANPAALDPTMEPRMSIKCLSETDIPAPPNDESVSAGIQRVCNLLRSRTLNIPPMANSTPPDFVSLVPNEFPPPQEPGDFGLAAADAKYSMAPFFINSDEALVMTGRWPDCRSGNVCLWNRFQQTYDYASRTVSLNRVQTQLEDDGSFKIVIAHEDPGVSNWLDTEGNLFGLVFWRFMLADGHAETPQATVVKLADLKT